MYLLRPHSALFTPSRLSKPQRSAATSSTISPTSKKVMNSIVFSFMVYVYHETFSRQYLYSLHYEVQYSDECDCVEQLSPNVPKSSSFSPHLTMWMPSQFAHLR